MEFEQIDKPVYNEEWRTVNFANQLAATETVQSAAIVVTRDSDGQTISDMVTDVTPYSSTYVKYWLKNGVAGTNYTMEVRVTTSANQKLSETFQICVY